MLPAVADRFITLGERGSTADHEVRQWQAGDGRSREIERGIRADARVCVQIASDPAEAESKLMRSLYSADVFSKLEAVTTIVARLNVDRPVESVLNRHPVMARIWNEDVPNSQFIETAKVRRRPVHLRSVQGGAERTDGRGVHEIRVA